MWSAKIQVNEKLQKLNLTKMLNRSQANAVQHVEAGACPNCPGKEAARKGVYNFIAKNQVVFFGLPLAPSRHDVAGDQAHVVFPAPA